MKKKICIIDGNSLLFRAYYATAYGDPSSIMRTKSGIPTNAIFAFANMLCKIISSFKEGESIFIGFDADKDTFRKEEFDAYKANRKPCPEELKTQFPISRDLVKALGIVSFELHGVEADDLCGTVAKKASKAGYEVMIYTSDKDYLQLIDENTKVSLLKTGLSNMNVMDEAKMIEEFGFTPLQIIDYKGLRGDSSDNLPGIPGVGEKTAVKLIQEYGSLEKIIEAAQTMKSKVGESIRTNAEQGRICYRLATIKTDVELPFSLDELVYTGYEFKEISDFATKYELKQFLYRLPPSWKKSSVSQKEIKIETIISFENKEIISPIGLALDIDYSKYHEDQLKGIAISSKDKVYYEAIDDIRKDNALKNILENGEIKKNVYDGKASIYALNDVGIKLEGIENDMLLISYLLDSSISSDPLVVFSSFGVDIGGNNDLSLLDSSDYEKIGKMAYFSSSLVDKGETALKNAEAYSLYREIEMPLMKVLSKMEIEGFPVHQEILKQYGEVFEKKKEMLEKEIYALSGSKFNINSPSQIAKVLYDDLKIPSPKNRSTSVEILDKLKDEYPIVSLILEYRKYAKLIGTYVEGLIPHIKEDNKIHSYFNQAQTTTGRLSSSCPNLQNISARDEEGKQIRKAFYYDDPNISLLSFDYGQIELRILAALSNCKAYIDVFNSGEDVHTETAKKIFKTDAPTSLMRRKAKAVNFAIIYGSTIWGLSEQIGTSPAEAGAIIDAFYEHYPEVGELSRKIIDDAITKGYVTTMFGRRRYLRDVNDPNYIKREAARRAALNAPVQGSAADLIKIAMVKIDEFLSKGKYKTKMVLQIHDELIFAVPSEEKEIMKKEIEKIMTSAVSMPVALTAEPNEGKTWYDAKD